MRILAELIGIMFILVGAYFGGRDLWDRWQNGPSKRKVKKGTN
jgi:hypothetical protein